MDREKQPWEEGYKPPTAAEAMDGSRPLPRSALDTLDYINGKDNYIDRLEDALREAIGWSYGEDVTPERRAEIEALLDD